MREPDSEDIASNPDPRDPLHAILARRLSRRSLLAELIGLGATTVLPGLTAAEDAPNRSAKTTLSAPGHFGFTEIQRGADPTLHVAPGYHTNVLLRWGDPLLAGAPAFNLSAPSLSAQRTAFGFNNDFVGFVPLATGSGQSTHGLLCVNHEYTDPRLMFPSSLRDDERSERSRVDIELAAHGGSIVEVRQQAGRWQLVSGSRYTRRINALDTPCRISGPAAGDQRMRTAADPRGTNVIGTLNNCAGGITPWGTYLMAEENFNKYFAGEREFHPETAHLARYGIPAGSRRWSRHHVRFDIEHEPNEPNRFGWIVEVDPLDPDAGPVKRTALGRFKHEGASCIVNHDGRLVVYSGDDQHMEYLYRFVSRDPVNRASRSANRDLLDHGTLSVARFDDHGKVHWLPMEHGKNGLDAAHGFRSQADVLIETRRAADLLGATPMDRPEDVEPNPVTGKVYVMLTGHSQRDPARVDAANPRAVNTWGHIIEITPDNSDHAAPSARWEILIQAGDPRQSAQHARWHSATSANGWFACPDNAAIDPAGRLWVCTDQGGAWRRISGGADGLWTLETDGALRGTGRLFMRAPIGAEVTGPCFTPDGRSLFVAVQHPGEGSTFEDPTTRWPDFNPEAPPRPAVIAITREDGGIIGS